MQRSQDFSEAEASAEALLILYNYYVFQGRVTLFFADNFSTECRITMEFLHNFSRPWSNF